MANYIDADKLKAEIERLKTVQLKRIQEGDLVDAEPYDKNEAYNELLSFLDTLESEKPMVLEEEINRYLCEECSDDDEPGIHEIAEHFAEWGYLRAAEKYNEIEYNRQRAEECVPNDLEEAAWDCVLDSVDVNNPVLLPKYKELLTYLFIAGAKWAMHYQEKKIVDAYEKGKQEGIRVVRSWESSPGQGGY